MRNALYRIDANETEHTEVIAPHAPREIELLFTVPPADRTLCVAAQNTQIIYMYAGSTKYTPQKKRYTLSQPLMRTL